MKPKAKNQNNKRIKSFLYQFLLWVIQWVKQEPESVIHICSIIYDLLKLINPDLP